MTTPSHRSFQLIATSRADDGTRRRALSSGEFADKNAGPAAFDVWETARQFPARWSLFLQQVYRSDVARIMHEFQVSERTARRWLSGEGKGVRGVHTAVAQARHPEEYREVVLAEAA